MSTQAISSDAGEAEFALVYRFLSDALPAYFTSGRAATVRFWVGEEYDGDYTASFLMTYDEFNETLVLALREFIATLAGEWKVIGSFDLITALDSNGQVIESPCFTVTRTGASGELNMEALFARKGSNLRRSTP